MGTPYFRFHRWPLSQNLRIFKGNVPSRGRMHVATGWDVVSLSFSLSLSLSCCFLFAYERGNTRTHIHNQPPCAPSIISSFDFSRATTMRRSLGWNPPLPSGDLFDSRHEKARSRTRVADRWLHHRTRAEKYNSVNGACVIIRSHFAK
jgi:hypothetical protein